MLICDHFVFLHLHKSGGTFINELIRHCMTGAHKIGYHLPYAELPKEARALPVLGTVRNPLGYYVSWYHFQKGMAKPNPLFTVCSDDGRDTFEQTITRLVTLHERPALVAKLAEVFPPDYVSHGLNLTSRCIRTIEGSGIGFYSFLYNRLYAGAALPTILTTDRLRKGLADYLAVHSPDTRACWQSFLREAPDMNRSVHDNVTNYYSRELRALVERMDQTIFSQHDF